MKKFFTLVLMMSLVGFLQAQTVPNGSFENWQEYTVVTTTYYEPEFWQTPNAFTGQVGTIVVSKSDDAFQGSFAARLETKDILGGMFQAPGLITLGTFNVNILTFEYTFGGGMATHQKVFSLSGKYKYEGVDNDSASVLIYSYKKDGDDYDTIGMGLAYLHNSSDWSDFNVNMFFLNDHQPDTFNVIIMSSSIESLIPGSVLLVDSLTMHTNVGIIDLNTNPMQVMTYPNPANDQISFETTQPSTKRMVYFFDILGKQLAVVSYPSTTLSVNLATFPSGTLYYRIDDPINGFSTGSFIKE